MADPVREGEPEAGLSARIEERLFRDVQEQLQPLLDSLAAVAAFDFGHPAPVTGRSPIIDSLAVGLNMLAEEIAARLAREEQLRASLAHHDRLATIGQLAAGVAHEVNNPATVVLAHLEMLAERFEERGGDSDERELIDESRQAMARITAVMRDLQIFSGVGKAQKEPVDFDAAVRAAARMTRKSLDLRADLELDLGAPPVTLGHAARLTQVFTSLLLETAHAVPDVFGRRGLIRIATRLDGKEIVATLEDDGRTIPADLQPRIFDPFLTGGHDDLGSGLTLSLAAEIVRQHEGTLALRSEAGHGTTFEIRLPLRTPASAAALPLRPGASRPVQSTATQPSLLLVDDDPTVLRISSRSLARAFAVTAVGSGRAALEALDRQTFDLVLCDVMMPDLDGVAVLEEVSRRHPAMAARFYFISGGAFTDRTRQFIESNPGRVFAKPLDFKRLIARLLDSV